jgi:hypothetical protein
MPDVGLYIGSRHDIIPLLLIPKINRWIYIDPLPVYKAGFEEDKYPAHLKKEMYSWFFLVLERPIFLVFIPLEADDSSNSLTLI